MPAHPVTLTRGNLVNWNQIFYFTEVAAAGSIKEAAKNLELTPSTLSEHISQLEESLKVSLFLRQHRKLVLTKEGRRIFQQSRQMFEVGQRMLDFVSPLALGDYPLAVGLVPSLGMRALMTFMGDFVRRYAETSIKIFNSSYEELARNLEEAKFDFGFSDQVVNHRNVVSESILSLEVEFYAATKLSHKPLEELMGTLPLLVYNSELGKRGVVELFLEESGITPLSIISADYPNILIDLCQRGLGVAVLGAYPDGIERGDKLRKLEFDSKIKKPKVELYAHWLESAANSKAIVTLKQVLENSNIQNLK